MAEQLSSWNNDETVIALKRGDGTAKTILAWNMLCGQKDPRYAVKLLEERVNAADGEAMWMLGVCKEFGIGTNKDTERAETLYEQSNKCMNETGKFLLSKVEYDRGGGAICVGCLLRNNHL